MDQQCTCSCSCGLHAGCMQMSPPLPDFQEFMRLAAKHKVLPSWWDTTDNAAIEKMAMTDMWANIYCNVEKSNITERYGSDTPLMLRIIAESVYKWSLHIGQPSLGALTSCASCGQAEDDTGLKLEKCRACGKVSCCSVECQKKHWNKGATSRHVARDRPSVRASICNLTHSMSRGRQNKVWNTGVRSSTKAALTSMNECQGTQIFLPTHCFVEGKGRHHGMRSLMAYILPCHGG